MLLKQFLYNKNNLSLSLISFFPIFFWFLIFGLSTIYEPYIWDDLHFFREYTNKELIEVWYQNWDHDNIETPGYRPLAIWYYHLTYLIFGENVILFRLFILSLMYLLIWIINKTLFDLKFNFNELILFSILIVFSKIFATLIAWFTISTLIICYLFAFLSINLFMRYIDNKKTLFYFLSLFFSVLSIFIREELYILPIIIFFFYFIKLEIKVKNFYFIINKLFPFFAFVILHLFLRNKYVPEADTFLIKNFSIYFGDKILGFGSIIKVLKSSFFPMGYPSFNNFDFYQYLLSIIWFFLIMFSVCYYFYKAKTFKVKSRNYLLFLIAFFCSLPHIAIARSFGIFLPSVFIILLLSSLILKIYKMGLLNFNNRFNFPKNLAVVTILIGVLGGIYRSHLHLNSMNQFSLDIVHYDSQFIYMWENLSIPEKRKIEKIKHLNNLNIFYYENNFEKILNSSKLIKSNIYKPLSF